MLFTTDAKRIWVGDGTTAGGVDPFATDPYADVFNVKLYGAVGDGVANDTAAIQATLAAADAAGGGTVKVPNGTYLVTLTAGVGLDLRGLSNFLIQGSPGSIIKLADGQCVASSAYYFVLMDANTANITIRDIAFDGNGENNATFTVADVLTVVGENVVVDACRIINAPDSGIMLSAAKYCKIVNNYIDGNSVSNGAATPATGWTTGATTDVGIYVNDGRTGAGNAGSAEIGYDAGAVVFDGCVISNNTVRRFRNGGIAIKRVTTGLIVSDNSIIGCGNGITFENGTYTGDSSLKCTISGNRIKDTGWINNSTGGRGIDLRWSHFTTVSANTVENSAGPSLMIEGSQRCAITGNVLVGSATVRSTDQHGIWVIARPDGTTANVYSTHNAICGNAVSGHRRSGIIMDSTLYTNGNFNNQVSGNISVGNGLTSGSNYSGMLPPIAAADDTSPSVLGMRIIKIPANSVSTAITQFDDGAPGQVVTVYTSDSTHASSIADGGNFVLAGGVAWAPDTAGDNITLLTTDGVTWIEMCRSNT
jgi:hypothetical protein